jgi:TfoX/Sxy family transcriptional regulator of competence genes
VAYDEELAHRVRELLGEEGGLAEQRMFGGLAFLLNGHMSVAVLSRGGCLVRVQPGATDAALGRPHTSPFEMAGRPVSGSIRVSTEGLQIKRQLTHWVRQGVEFARTSPPKGASARAGG